MSSLACRRRRFDGLVLTDKFAALKLARKLLNNMASSKTSRSPTNLRNFRRLPVILGVAKRRVMLIDGARRFGLRCYDTIIGGQTAEEAVDDGAGDRRSR